MAPPPGARIVSDLSQYGGITHFVTPSDESNHLRRTCKSMAAMSKKAVFLNPDWLIKSYEDGALSPCDDYRITTDRLAEEKYGISMTAAFKNAMIASKSGGILVSLVVHFGKGVAGEKNNAPPLADLKHLVTIAGGSVAATQADASATDPSRLVIVCKDKESKLSTKLASAQCNGATRIVLATLFDILFQQRLDPIQNAKVRTEPAPETPSPKTPRTLHTVLQNIGFYDVASGEGAGKGSKSSAAKTTSDDTAESGAEAEDATKRKKSALPRIKLTLRSEKTQEVAVQTDDTEASFSRNNPFETPKKSADEQEYSTIWASSVDNCWRLLSNHTLENPERGDFGPGTLLLQKHNKTGCMIARFTDATGKLHLDAAVPELDVVHKSVQGNNGREPAFFWEAENMAHTSGGTTVKGAKNLFGATALRRFNFLFKTNSDLTLLLFWFFRQSMPTLNEFFDQDGRFTHLQNTLPPHEIVKDPDAMDTDEDGIAARLPAHTGPELEDVYGNDPAGFSQALYPF